MLQASSYQNKTPESRQMVRMPSGCVAFSPTPTPNQIPKLVLEIRSFLGPQLFHSGVPSCIWGGEWWLALLFKLIKSSGSRIPFPSVGCLGLTCCQRHLLKEARSKAESCPLTNCHFARHSATWLLTEKRNRSKESFWPDINSCCSDLVSWSVCPSIDRSINQPTKKIFIGPAD